MKTYEVTVERMIDAAHPQVYNAVIDMEEHRRILPKQFESLEVLKGGKGQGTVFRLNMNVMGNRSLLEFSLTEPEPGRIVQEQDDKAGVVTIWKLSPNEKGDKCLIQLTTKFRSKPGIVGILERLFIPPVIRSIYRQELDNINEYLKIGQESEKR